ncbi:tetratricopeptide repeat-containing protein [Besnoitia besnoiti]|uniref:Tetratricopeptide repeat-containing protein n=1 Tax=Besnoitia besnoiti TaxID=94643 RepID=A0A2A9MQ70_BESBE|nr:tetratricopeptide repeat-containing protein [Besnoitia besnoiti]PFH38626.1 tetratricopeptide repeat-containing protein [Besnoitia besnoiti]
MAFRALLSQPRAANPCAADASRVASAAASGAGSNALTSFLSSVSTDPLRTRQLLEGYDVASALAGPPPALPEALLASSLLASETLGPADSPFPGDALDAAWKQAQQTQACGLEGADAHAGDAPALGRPPDGLESFHGLAGPETLSIHAPPSGELHQFGHAAPRTGLPFAAPLQSEEVPRYSLPPHLSTQDFASAGCVPGASLLQRPGGFSSTVPPQSAELSPFHVGPPSAPAHGDLGSEGEAAAAGWLDEFRAFAHREASSALEFSSQKKRDPEALRLLASASSPEGPLGETQADQTRPATAPTHSAPRASPFGPFSSPPLLAFPHPPPQVPIYEPGGFFWDRDATAFSSEAHRNSLAAARIAQRAAGIQPRSSFNSCSSSSASPSSSASSAASAATAALERDAQARGGAEAEAGGPQRRAATFDAAAARDMLQSLKAMGEEKLERSEFGHFIRQLAAGELSIEDGQLVDATGKPVDWDAHLRATRAAERPNAQADAPTKEDTGGKDDGSAEECASFEQSMRELEQAWTQARDNGEIDEEELSLFRSIFNTAELSKAFATSADDEASLMEGLCPHVDRGEAAGDLGLREAEGGATPAFSKDNPYLSEPDPLARALRLLEEGKLQEAVKALEAEVQQNPNSSEGWRLLGEALADSEQDADAILCLKKGHEVDPYNLDSLLALGVSLTNELDAPQALRNLRDWLANHDELSALPGLKRPVPEDFEELKKHVISLFRDAAAWKGGIEGDVHLALGVIFNIDQNFNKALFHFTEALKFASGRRAASLWNKIGATLANSGRSAAALLAYGQTLAMRPNYPRAWTNLGVAHSNLGDTERALQYYLTALSLNPLASHLWYYVRSAVISLGKFDWLGLAENRDLEGLRALMLAGTVPTREALLEKGAARAPQEDAEILQQIFQAIRQAA